MCLLIREHCPCLEQLELYCNYDEGDFFDSTILARLIRAATSFENPCFTIIRAHFTFLEDEDDNGQSYASLASRWFEMVATQGDLSLLCFASTLKKITFRCYLYDDELEVVEREIWRNEWETKQRVEQTEQTEQDKIAPDIAVVDITWKRSGTD